MKVSVIVHKAEEGGYWAEVPAIPGCATQGETRKDFCQCSRGRRRLPQRHTGLSRAWKQGTISLPPNKTGEAARGRVGRLGVPRPPKAKRNLERSLKKQLENRTTSKKKRWRRKREVDIAPAVRMGIAGIPHQRAIRALKKAGFRVVRQSKHIVMTDGKRVVTIPRHDPVNANTMAIIVQATGLTAEEFRKLL